MSASLSDPLAKLRRAGDHLNALHIAAQAFIDRQPYQIITEQEAEGWRVFYLKVREPPPIELGTVFGDLLHNLRSALDNLVTQLILLNDKPVPRITGFPVFDKERKFKAVGVKRINGVRSDHAAIIEGLQPYHGRTDATARAVELLSSYANLDRHKLVHPTFVGPAQTDIPFIFRRKPIDTNVVIEGQVTAAGFRLEDGAELARLRVGVEPGQPQVSVKAEALVEIAFGEGLLRLTALPTIAGEITSLIKDFDPDFPEQVFPT